MRISKGEEKIISILKSEHIEFIREQQFKDCRSGFLRYDFFCPQDNILIEFNGIQHYEYNSHFFKNKSEWMKAQERDRQKISYALAKGITIYCIPYWDIDRLTSAADLFSLEYRATSKFHNDKAWRAHQNH